MSNMVNSYSIVNNYSINKLIHYNIHKISNRQISLYPKLESILKIQNQNYELLNIVIVSQKNYRELGKSVIGNVA